MEIQNFSLSEEKIFHKWLLCFFSSFCLAFNVSLNLINSGSMNSLFPYLHLVRYMKQSTLDKIPLREDSSYSSPFFVLAAIMNSLSYTCIFTSSGGILSNFLSSFRNSQRNFTAMFRSYIIFFFVFLFSGWAVSSSTSNNIQIPVLR